MFDGDASFFKAFSTKLTVTEMTGVSDVMALQHRLYVVNYCVLLMLPFVVHAQDHTRDLRMPPRILKGPGGENIYRSGGEVMLKCEADGTPRPSYEWWKNGVALQPQMNMEYLGEGVIKLKSLSRMDEGYYQCRANNMYGVALSNVTTLMMAKLGSYQSSEAVDVPGLVEGHPHSINCNPVSCYPDPSYSWSIAKSTVDNSPLPVIRSKRIQIDDYGNLHFSYLQKGDEQNLGLYKCNVLNPNMDLTIGGSYTRLHISPVPQINNFSPIIGFSSPMTVVALLNEKVTLRCFFSGFPDPVLTWSRAGNAQMPIGRYELANYNTELIIRRVEPSDEGGYICEGHSVSGRKQVTMQIDVQSKPSFNSPNDWPRAVNLTEGDDLRMVCHANGEPAVSVDWLQNGSPISHFNLPPRMKLSDDGTELFLSNVCKNCAEGSSDLQVFQCNASNVHGYIFKDAYLNVLYKTRITDRPQNLHMPFDGSMAQFSCAATGDDSTPIVVQWHRHGPSMPRVDTETGNVNITVSSDRSSSQLTFHVRVNDSLGWARVVGMYRCTASNGYSSDDADFELSVDLPPVPDNVEETTSTPIAENLAQSVVDLWWILVIIVVLLFALIIIIICCLCCTKCKGDTYYVERKERQDHKDPEKELADSALQPYRRPDVDPLKENLVSMTGSMKEDSDDDEESLNEYGDIDAGKFTEDGSFIGDYNTEQRRHHGSGDVFA